MKKYIVCGACIVFGINSAVGFGLRGYVSLRGGMSKTMIKTSDAVNGGPGWYLPNNDWNFSFNPNLGTRITFNNWRTGAFRIDAEYTLSQKISVGMAGVNYNISMDGGFTNVYFDFYTQSRFKPFVVGAVGYGVLKVVENDGAGDVVHSTKNLIWNVGGGITYIMTNRFYVDAMYRYVDYGKLKTVHELTFEYTASEILFGVRYMF